MQATAEFWLEDTPAVGGLERALLYGALLAVCHFSYLARPPLGDSPLQAPELFRATDLDLFFEVRGVVEFVPLHWLRSFGYRGIDAVRRVVYASWICCILGVFGHAPVVVTSFGMLFLEMVKISCTGVGHRMHLVVYMLVFLSLSNGRRTHSIDELLFRHFPDSWSLFNPHNSHPVLYSGLATKLGLVASSFTLWVGATTKIVNGGWRWLDGSTLAWQTISSPFGALPLMKKLFAVPAFAAFSAFSAVIFEAGSFSIQFPSLKPWRPIWMLMCFAFHFVIFLTMNPNYLPQSLVYVPCVLTLSAPTPATPLLAITVDPVADLFGFSCIVFANSFLLILVAVAVFRIEFWPLTCIPMYSFYRGHLLGDVKRQASRGGNVENVGITARQLCELAVEYKTMNPRCIGWLDSWVDVCLVPAAAAGSSSGSSSSGSSRSGRRGRSRSRSSSTREARLSGMQVEETEAYSLRNYIRQGRAQRSLYRLVLSKVICQTKLLQEEGSNEPKSSPAVQFLCLLVSILSRPSNVKSKKEMEQDATKKLRAPSWDLAVCYRCSGGGWVAVGRVPYRR